MSEKVMTDEELTSRINEAVLRGVQGDALKTVVADTMKTYLDSHGVRAQIVSVFADEEKKARAAKRTTSPWAGAAALCIDAGRRALGMGVHPEVRDKVREHMDLEKYQERRAAEFARTGQSSTTTAGGYLIPTEEELTPIELVGADAAESLISKCNHVPMQTGTKTIVTLATDITVSWVPETTDTSSMASQATGQKPETQFAFGLVTLNRYMAVAKVRTSRQVLNYSQGYMEQVLRKHLPGRIRAAFAKAILRGTATAATDPITGLDTGVTGANVVEWSAANPFGSLLRTIMQPEIALPGDICETDLCITSARGVLALRDVRDTTGRPILGDPDKQTRQLFPLYGYPLLKTSNVLDTYPAGTGTQSRFYAGDFGRHAHVGLDNALFVLVDPYSGKDNNLVDFLFEIPAGFVYSSASAFAYTDIPRA